MTSYPSYRAKILGLVLLNIWKSASLGRNISVLFLLLTRFIIETREHFHNDWKHSDENVY
jgi:hypothetical protein